MKKTIIFGVIVFIVIAAIGLVSIVIGAQNNDPDGQIPFGQDYRQITQDEAKSMMEKDDGHIIVDVRRQDEFDAGHILGAVCIPNEDIGSERPKQLPDLDQIILVYCRSGRRSKEASQKLSALGYTNVYEFGGILEWTGELMTEEPTGFEPVS